MALIEGLNYVESNIRNELLEIETPTNTSNSTLVIGTARQGPSKTLTKARYTDAAQTFGDAPLAADFDTNAVHAAVSIQASTAARDHEMYIYKVGDSQPASLDLYEAQVKKQAGDEAYSFDSDDKPIVCMTFKHRQENDTGNDVSVLVRGDTLADGTGSGLPSAVSITLEDGYSRIFAVDPYGVRPGVPSNVQELTNVINEDDTIRQALDVGFNVLEKSNLTVTVQQESSSSDPYIEVDYPGGTSDFQSWGDKLVDVSELMQELPAHTEELAAGQQSYRVAYAPDKTLDPLIPSVDVFVRVKENETILSATTADIQAGKDAASKISKALTLTSPALAWNQDEAYVITTLEVKLYRGGQTYDIPEHTTDGWTLNANGILDVIIPDAVDADGAKPGDLIRASYKFKCSLEEAKTRSELGAQNENKYFVAGSDVVFGSTLSLPMEITYKAIKVFALSDLSLLDRNNIKIAFINAANAPEEAEEVKITFTYLPELPAPTSETIYDKLDAVYTVQKGGLAGGTSGSLITKQRYQELVTAALDLTLLVPFRRVIIAGAWLDDIIDGIDPETGMPGRVNLNWGQLVINNLDLKSRVAGECHGLVGVKPISNALLARGEEGINEWYQYLLDELDDPTSAASIMASLNDYHLDVALGAPYVTDGNILSGAGYVENPAYVVCGMQLDGNLSQSLIKSAVPPFVQNLLVTFPSGGIVGKLNTAHYTTLVVNAKGQMRVADAPTASAIEQSMARQLVRDTTYVAVRLAREVADGYIGLRRDARTLGIMKTKINNAVIDSMVPDFLEFFQVELIPTPGGHITGETKLRLILVTHVEIRRVIFETTVRLGGEDL